MMMTNWFKIAKDGILNKLDRVLPLPPLENNTEVACTAVTAKRTSVMAVYDLDKSKKSMMEIAPQPWCIKLENQKWTRMTFMIMRRVKSLKLTSSPS